MRVFLFIVAFQLCAIAANAQDSSGWQTSSAANVRLSVRNKFAQKPYSVKWLVSVGKDSFTATKNAKADEELVVNYPEDFGGSSQDGKYLWNANVNGKTVLSGWFTYASVGTADKFGFRDRQITFHENN